MADRIAQGEAAQRPIIAELRAAGLDVDSLSELVNGSNFYDKYLPMLADWIPRCDYLPIRQMLVRAITVPAARRTGVATLLLDEFERADGEPGYQWVVGNALAVVARPQDAGRVLELFQDRRHGAGRQELARAIARLKPRGALEVLVAALDDDDVSAHAAEALGILRDPNALPALTRLQQHERPLVARMARAAVKKIEARPTGS